jgi:hypothetical protein
MIPSPSILTTMQALNNCCTEMSETIYGQVGTVCPMHGFDPFLAENISNILVPIITFKWHKEKPDQFGELELWLNAVEKVAGNAKMPLITL